MLPLCRAVLLAALLATLACAPARGVPPAGPEPGGGSRPAGPPKPAPEARSGAAPLVFHPFEGRGVRVPRTPPKAAGSTQPVQPQGGQAPAPGAGPFKPYQRAAPKPAAPKPAAPKPAAPKPAPADLEETAGSGPLPLEGAP